MTTPVTLLPATISGRSRATARAAARGPAVTCRLEGHHVLDRRRQAEAAVGEFRAVGHGSDELLGARVGFLDVEGTAAHALGDAVDRVDDRVAGGVEHDLAAAVVGGLGHDALDCAADGGDVGALVGSQEVAGHRAARTCHKQGLESRQGHDGLLRRRLGRAGYGSQHYRRKGGKDDHQQRRASHRAGGRPAVWWWCGVAACPIDCWCSVHVPPLSCSTVTSAQESTPDGGPMCR